MEHRDSGHGEIGELESGRHDGGRRYGELYQHGCEKDSKRPPGPGEKESRLPDDDEKESPDQRGGGSCHDGVEGRYHEYEDISDDIGGGEPSKY